MDLNELKKNLGKMSSPEVEQQMADAIAFANKELAGRSQAFNGALLGLLVGAIFGPQPLENFDTWHQLIRADLERRQIAVKQAREYAKVPQ